MAEHNERVSTRATDKVNELTPIDIPQAPSQSVHACTDECDFVYCPNDPQLWDDESDDLNSYPGDWMMYIHSQDEDELLAEAFGGWGFKITTRP